MTPHPPERRRSRRRQLPFSLVACVAAIASLATATPALGQGSDSADVVAVAQRMFDAMRTRDTAALRSVFDPAGRLVSVTRQGAVRAESPDDFIRAVGRDPTGPVWNERMWSPEVRIDGNIAQLWVQYDFHLGDKFSHCGIDAFQLAKTSGGWRIVQVADTRRTTGCTPPPAK